MSSQAQIEANRRNSMRSTGPSSTWGKFCSSQNSFKHGKYDADWAASFGAHDPARRRLAARAAAAERALDRLARAEDARTAKRCRHAAADFDRERDDRAGALGNNLLVGLIEPVRPYATGWDY